MTMNRKVLRNRRPAVEALESKALLSSIGPMTALGHASALVAAESARSVAVTGTFHGVYTRSAPIPDIGQGYGFEGSGKARPLGHADLFGNLRLPGNIAVGHATWVVTLTSIRGSLTLRLDGPAQPGLSPPPKELSYVIVSGTGRFKSAHGSGRVELSLALGPAQPQPVGTMPVSSGRFRMVFRS
jgi:hypothetical protein